MKLHSTLENLLGPSEESKMESISPDKEEKIDQKSLWRKIKSIISSFCNVKTELQMMQRNSDENQKYKLFCNSLMKRANVENIEQLKNIYLNKDGNVGTPETEKIEENN